MRFWPNWGQVDCDGSVGLIDHSALHYLRASDKRLKTTKENRRKERPRATRAGNLTRTPANIPPKWPKFGGCNVYGSRNTSNWTGEISSLYGLVQRECLRNQGRSIDRRVQESGRISGL